MEPFAPELVSGEVFIYIGTKYSTRKIQEIQQNKKVGLSYHDPDGVGYVAIQGEAIIVDDTDFELRKKYWRYFILIVFGNTATSITHSQLLLGTRGSIFTPKPPQQMTNIY